MEKTLKNPFVVGRYVSEKYFCDREEETSFLKKNIENGRNVAIISSRRLGKTGLINHFFAKKDIKNDYYTFFVDIYATSSLSELVYLLGKTIYDELKPKKTQWSERFFSIISSLRMGFKLDTITGEPTFDIGLGDIQSPHTTLDEIFKYLEDADKPCIVAIDEFQQIGNYAEKNVEALLRTKIQQCVNTQLIFSGSKRHIMSNMFNSASKPFYQSAISMSLAPIPQETYADFATGLFKEWGKEINRTLIDEVYKLYDGHTWFIQMIMNELFALTAQDEMCDIDMLSIARKNIVLSQENSYKEILSHLSHKQKILLQAVAKEKIVNGITSAQFVSKYNLSSASSVQAALKPLLDNDIVTQDNNRYRVYDFFFADWLQNIF